MNHPTLWKAKCGQKIMKIRLNKRMVYICLVMRFSVTSLSEKPMWISNRGKRSLGCRTRETMPILLCLKSSACSYFAVYQLGPWTSQLASLELSFLPCKMGIFLLNYISLLKCQDQMQVVSLSLQRILSYFIHVVENPFFLDMTDITNF